MANRITYGKVDLEQYLTDSLKAIGTKLGITIPVRTEGWFELRRSVENAQKQISTATGSPVVFDISNPTALATSLGAVVPVLLAGDGGPVAPTLGTVTLSGTLTQGVAASNVSIAGATNGSTITFNIVGLSVGTSGTTRAVTGTPTTSGR